MTFASRTQFHIERPWGQRLFSIVSWLWNRWIDLRHYWSISMRGGVAHGILWAELLAAARHLARWCQVTPGPAPPLLFIMIKVVTKSGARERELGREPRAILPYLQWQTAWPFYAHLTKNWCFHSFLLAKMFFFRLFSLGVHHYVTGELPIFSWVIFSQQNHH